MVPGYVYPERIQAGNCGDINEWVRITIHRLWIDSDGSPIPSLDSAKIQYELDNENDWIVDESASTPSRIILYYKYLLNVDETTSSPIKSIKIDESVNTEYQFTSEGEEHTNISMVKPYAGKKISVEVEVDGVQEDNAVAAIRSAWGKDVTIIGNELSLDD